MLAREPIRSGVVASTVNGALESFVKAGEVTPPGDVAETIAFLASGRARHATGTTVDITGADYVR